MKLAKRDIPTRAAVAVIGIVLVASIVSSRDQSAGATPLPRSPQAEAAGSPRTAQQAALQETLADLDMAKLRHQRWSEGVASLLTPRTAPPPPAQLAVHAAPAVAPSAPPAPVAPPLPFAYLGKIIEGGRTTVFVARGPDHYSIETGSEIDQYKVENVTETQITFVYRPLGMRQVLAVPQPGQEPAR
jgi:hypothetical protein